MAKRIAFIGVLIVSLALLPGCPDAASPFVGTWIMTINNLDRGLEVLPNGEATSFLIDSQLSGTLKWWQEGDQFVLNQYAGGNNIIYSASLLNNGNSMNGALVSWAGIGQGSAAVWTAAKQ